MAPDHRTVVWTSQASGQGHLYTKRIGAKGEHKVTPEWGRFVREVGASFSPDGKQLIYSSTLGGSYQLWRLPSLGSVGLQVTETKQPVKDAQTTWSADGETIAFYSNRSGSFDIWAVNATGNAKPRAFTNWESNEIYPAFSPDGKLLAFVSNHEGNPDIWVRDMTSGEARALIEHPAEEGPVAWSPNGRRLYFTSNRSGRFEIYVMPAGGGEAKLVKINTGGSLPETALFTKFAVTPRELIAPLERRRGEIYLLENLH
ncbi:MAG: hypothetical protein GY953_53945, partial [bacterium]|nr:hypothetical protein [bacterium]